MQKENKFNKFVKKKTKPKRCYSGKDLERYANWIADYWNFVCNVRLERFLYGLDTFDLDDNFDWSKYDFDNYGECSMPLTREQSSKNRLKDLYAEPMHYKSIARLVEQEEKIFLQRMRAERQQALLDDEWWDNLKVD